MSNKLYRTVNELIEAGPTDIPVDMLSGENLIYSSPATLSYNSPGAQGFGVKRAGLVIPESIMLVVSPACCGRNTTVLADEGGYSDRIFFLQMDETDIVTGRHLTEIPEAINQIVDVCAVRPKAVVICITCVDALLGTDLERVCRKAEKECGIKVVPSYMYALTREGKNPPMVAIRETIYSLIERPEVRPEMVNFIGNFTHLEDDCELYDLFRQIGLTDIREVGRCTSYEEYLEMGRANFNLILNPEARKAAMSLDKRLGMPFAELTRVYEIERIRKQYTLFGAALGVEFDDQKYYDEAKEAIGRLADCMKGMTVSIGQVVNGNPIEMALALSQLGINVRSVFATVTPEEYPYMREIAELNPDMRIYQALSPNMLNFNGEEQVDVAIGMDCSFYYPNAINVLWNDEAQPFGYRGLVNFANRIIETINNAQNGTEDTKQTAKTETPDRLQQYLAYNPDGYKARHKVRGLRKYLSPFTPDQSGAESVLFAYGGMLIIMDAGGCVGNVCGYDEPRWTKSKSAIFSAGLRDLDAILGRDEVLIRKTGDALQMAPADFVGLIGTPVPAVIATDYRALKRLMEKKFGIPVVPVETNGIDLYDAGQEKAYMQLFRTFIGPKSSADSSTIPADSATVSADSHMASASSSTIPADSRRIGIIGATPLDTAGAKSDECFAEAIRREYGEDVTTICYGVSDSLADVAVADRVERNIVVSPSGIKAAKHLEDKYGTPYEIAYPMAERQIEEFNRRIADAILNEYREGAKVLIVHQQVFAGSLRELLMSRAASAGKKLEIDTATWFMHRQVIAHEGDSKLCEEDELQKLVSDRGYDVVIGDPLYRRALPEFNGMFLSLPHYVVSGELRETADAYEYFEKAGERI